MIGGESAHDAVAMEAAWARGDWEWCRQHSIPFYFKQWGGSPADKGGCLLDGVEVKQLPPTA